MADWQSFSVPSRLAALAIVLFLAAGMHWLLWLAGRRLPVWLGTRFAVERSRYLDWRTYFELTLWPAKLSLWLTATYLACELFLPLRHARTAVLQLLAESVTRPLFRLNQRAFSASDLMLLPLFLATIWAVASVSAWLLRERILGPAKLEPSVREGIATIVRYSLVLLGGLVVLQIWGIDAQTLAIAGGVVGIGIGFGLQNIANNFISGLLLGLERPIKAGDFIEVSAHTGVVERIGARSTVVRTQDRVNILIPNSRFLDSEVINWSHGDPVSRLRIPVSVAYGSAASRVRSTLLEVARRNREVLMDPRPQVQLVGFGSSSLDFELLVFTDEPHNQARLRSDLNFAIESALRDATIEIPFPQMDVYLRASPFDRVLERWSRTLPLAGEEAPPEETSATPIPRERGAVSIFEDQVSDADLFAIVEKMRSEGGIEIRDRRHRLTHYRSCFVGREAVDWLVSNQGMTRQEAVQVGQLLLERSHLHHVLDEHPFLDGYLFYRFV